MLDNTWRSWKSYHD